MDTVTVLSREEILVTRVADRLGLMGSTTRSPHKSLPELCPLVRELGLGKDCGERGREGENSCLGRVKAGRFHG